MKFLLALSLGALALPLWGANRPLPLPRHPDHLLVLMEKEGLKAPFPSGREVLGGVEFDIGDPVSLMGTMAARQMGAASLLGEVSIPVNARGRVLHLLHASFFSEAEEEPLFDLVFHYAGGGSKSTRIYLGRHSLFFADVEGQGPSALTDPDSSIVWTGQTSVPAEITLRMIRTSIPNPEPEKTIQRIELLSCFPGAAPLIWAATLADGPAPKQPFQPSNPDLSTLRKTILLRLADAATGRPVQGAEATVEIMAGGSGMNLRGASSNARGELRLALPADTAQVSVQLRSPTHLLQSVKILPQDGKLPVEFPVRLAAGGAIGGTVVDKADRKPVSGAEVQVIGVTRDDVGQVVMADMGTVRTGRDGRWQIRSVPEALDGFAFKVTHPEFLPAEFEVEETAPRPVTAQQLKKRQARLELEAAYRITGSVTASGKPVARAEVYLEKQGEGKPRRVRTDERGQFSLVIQEEAGFEVAVAAPGRAPARQSVQAGPGLQPLKFELAQGRRITGRVINPSEQPVAGAVVRLVEWNGHPVLDWKTETDAEGNFAWNDAPEGRIGFAVEKQGFEPVAQHIVQGEGPQIVRLTAGFVFSAKVIDAATREPIKQFTYTPGYSWRGVADEVRWEQHLARKGQEGAFQGEYKPQNQGVDRVQYKVEADGYLPMESPAYPAKGWHQHEFLLQKGSGPSGTVFFQDGSPAAGARVAILPSPDHIALGKEGLTLRQGVGATADGEGRFALKPVLRGKWIVATHDRGIAQLSLEAFQQSGRLEIQPWGRIEGVVKIGKKGGEGELVTVAHERNKHYLNYDSTIYWRTSAVTGTFTIERVPPGERVVHRLVPMGGRSWTWSDFHPVQVKPGETTRVVIGGEGRLVRGRFKIPTDAKVDFQSGHKSFSSKIEVPQFANQQEAQQYVRSEEYLARQQVQRHHAIEVEEDGSFVIYAVMPGTYQLHGFFNEAGSNRSRASVQKEVVIPDEKTAEPFDLGEVVISAW